MGRSKWFIARLEWVKGDPGPRTAGFCKDGTCVRRFERWWQLVGEGEGWRIVGCVPFTACYGYHSGTREQPDSYELGSNGLDVVFIFFISLILTVTEMKPGRIFGIKLKNGLYIF